MYLMFIYLVESALKLKVTTELEKKKSGLKPLISHQLCRDKCGRAVDSPTDQMSDEGSMGGRVELLELHDGGLASDVTQLSALLLGAPSLSPNWTALSVCRPVSPRGNVTWWTQTIISFQVSSQLEHSIASVQSCPRHTLPTLQSQAGTGTCAKTSRMRQTECQS